MKFGIYSNASNKTVWWLQQADLSYEAGITNNEIIQNIEVLYYDVILVLQPDLLK